MSAAAAPLAGGAGPRLTSAPPPLRILLVYETLYPATIGGVEHRNAELAVAMRRRGHQVTLAGFGLATDPNAGVISLGPVGRVYNAGAKRSTRHALRFARAVARLEVGGYDLVETANMNYAHLPVLARRCRRARVPLLVTWYEFWRDYWGEYIGRLRAPVYRGIEAWCARLGTAVAATSTLTAKRLTRARSGPPPALLACGLDTARVAAAAAAAASSAGPPLIFAGRLLAHKRVDLLLRAVRLLAERGRTGVLATIYGDGPESASLQRLAAELGVAERVRFTGFLPTSEEVFRGLGGARLAIQPSGREGFGLFPLEAMAAGLPVVYCAGSETAVGELVRDGIEGVETSRDAAALARAIERLLADDGLRERMARAARARAAEYDWQFVAARFESLCLGLIAETGSTAPRHRQ